MESASSKSWWVYLLQGAATTIFGLAALAWPGITVFTFIILFGVFAVMVGTSRLATSLRNRQESGWWLVPLSGIAGIGVGLLAFAWPAATGLVLLYMIGAHALINGVAAVWRTVANLGQGQGGWLTLLGGVAAIAFGFLAFAWPGATALTLTWLIGVYAIVFGVSEMISSFAVRRTDGRSRG